MNPGKEQYDNISIPARLEQVILEAMDKAVQDNRRTRLRRWIAGAAAVFCMLFLSANITPIYAYASQIPVLGNVVRVLHIGTGGERTDGVFSDAQTAGEAVQFRFERSSQTLESVPVYSITHLLAPNRIVLTLHGVRGIDYQGIRESLLTTDAVQNVYRQMLGDDSMIGFVIVLNGGYTFEVMEYANPASLCLLFYAGQEKQPERTVYYLRSEAVPYGEALGLMSEKFFRDGATQLQTRQGDYIITIGQYDTREEAETALMTLEEKYGGETGLYVASGKTDEIPEY